MTSNDVMGHTISDDGLRRVGATMPFSVDRRVEGALHAAVVRSIVPHGKIREIDRSEAEAADGVRRVVVGTEVADHPRVASIVYGETRTDQPVMAVDRVRYVGEPVAVVVAETPHQARLAARLVFVDYDELPFETDAEQSGRPDATVLHDDYPDNDCGRYELIHGDVEDGFAQADHVYEHEYHSPRASHVPMEPHVTTARWDDDHLEVWTGTQAPYNVRKRLSAIFGLDPSQVRVRGDNLGGGFGSKTDARIEPLVAATALVTGDPVRLELSREEVFQTLAKHAARVRIKTGVTSEGIFTARQIDIIYDAGAYANTTPRSTRTGMLRSPGPYRIPHVRADAAGRYTNTVPTGPFRGAMTGQVCWAHESTIDEIALDLGIDPLELRRRNVLQEGDTYATGETMHDIRYLELLDKVREELGDAGEPSGPGRARGIGYALVIKSTRTPSRSEAIVRAMPDGQFILYTSSVDMGQGGQVALARELADSLGVALEDIQVSCADTDHTPFDATTSSSRTTFFMGNAVRDAAANLTNTLRETGAEILGVDAAHLTLEDGCLESGDQSLDIREVASRHGQPLEAHGAYETPEGMGVLDEATQGIASVHWHQGVVGVEIEVDTETGIIEVVRARGVSYAGRVVDALKVQKQTEGGMTFGMGQALFEELQFDDGQLTNPNMSDYLIPSILDVPTDLAGSTIENDSPDAHVHGVGENTVPPMAPAIANALADAVGVRIRHLPLTAERVLRALREQEAS